jgi:hypothetical protein
MTEPLHLSAYQLDSLRAGRLDGDVARAARGHLAGCPTCRRLEDSLIADQRHFAQEVLPRTRATLRARLESTPRPRPWPRWAFLTLAPAAVLFLLVVRPQHQAGYQAVKGGPSFQVVARRAGRTFPVTGAGPLAPGDTIRFVVSSPRPFLMIAAVDAQGHSQVYAPFEGKESAAVATDQRLELPEGGSIQLDATPGPERIFALFSRRPLPAQTVLMALDRLGARGAEALRSTERLDVAADAQLSELLEKAGR